MRNGRRFLLLQSREVNGDGSAPPHNDGIERQNWTGYCFEISSNQLIP
jgi:hypothetical protein